MLANLPMLMKYAKSVQRDGSSGQSGLFDTLPSDLPALNMVELPDWGIAEKMWFERKTTGAYFSGHPTDLVRAKWAHKVTRKVNEFEQLFDHGSAEPIIVLGLILKVFPKSFGSVVEIEDETGRGEIVLSRDTADRYAYLLWKDVLALFKLVVRRGEHRTSMDVKMAARVGKFTEPEIPALARKSKRG